MLSNMNDMEILVRQHYLDKIEKYLGKDTIIVLTGQRRVGKSYTLRMIRDLKSKDENNNVIYVDKEKKAFDHIKTYQDLNAYIDAHYQVGKMNYILIDEVQEIEEFERTVRSYRTEPDAEVIVTGSNAKMLSKELSTIIGGRYKEIYVQSLSYKEFLQFHNLQDGDDALAKYIQFGGLPGLKKMGLDEDDAIEYQKDVLNTVLLKDVISRNNIRNVPFLEKLTSFIADNIGILATGRTIIFDGNKDLSKPYQLANDFQRMESVATFGGSLSQTFTLVEYRDATLSFDYFRTEFLNRVLADQEWDADYVNIYATDGRSFTDNYQVDFTWTPIERFDIFATFRYTNAKQTIERADGSTALVESPRVSRFKTLLNLQYATKFRRWVFDVTAQYNGKCRLPSLDGDIKSVKYSPAYPMLFAQVSYKIKTWDIYVGCENILGYRQKDPILLGGEKMTAGANPYDTSFNSSVVSNLFLPTGLYLLHELTGVRDCTVQLPFPSLAGMVSPCCEPANTPRSLLDARSVC